MNSREPDLNAVRALLVSLLGLPLLLGCTQLFFHPNSLVVNAPEHFGLEYESLDIKASDGTALSAWFLPARGEARGTVLYLHGSAENISTHFTNVAWMPGAGFNVLTFDYRGYGRSGGSPSLKGAQFDIDAALATLLVRQDIDPKRIVIVGQSLGAALAIHYVAHSAYRANVRALVAEGAFSDYVLIASEKADSFFITRPFRRLARLAVDNDYSPQAAIRSVQPIPLLLIHGDEDMIVPLHHSEKLYELASEPKELWVVPATGHVEALKSEAIRKRLTEFLLRYVG